MRSRQVVVGSAGPRRRSPSSRGSRARQVRANNAALAARIAEEIRPVRTLDPLEAFAEREDRRMLRRLLADPSTASLADEVRRARAYAVGSEALETPSANARKSC